MWWSRPSNQVSQWYSGTFFTRDGLGDSTKSKKVVSLGESVSSFSCRPFEPISDLLSLFFDYSLWNKQKSELTLIIDFHSEKQNITLGQS